MNPLERLRYHVTGAIERGEAIAVIGIEPKTVTPDYAIGYMSSDMSRVTDWHGEVIGDHVRVVSSWPIDSYLSSRQYHIECTINGRRYTGRTMGAGMLWRGKAKKGN